MEESRKNEAAYADDEAQGVATTPHDEAARAAAQMDPWAAYRPYLTSFVKGEVIQEITESEKVNSMVRKMTKSGSFNWMTLLLGPLYWVYRRCYVEAAAYFGVLLLVFAPLRFVLGIRLTSTAALVAGFLFYPLYRRRAMRAYHDAYAAHSGSEEEMRQAMREAGGTNIVGSLVVFLCYFVAALLISWLVASVFGARIVGGRYVL